MMCSCEDEANLAHDASDLCDCSASFRGATYRMSPKVRCGEDLRDRSLHITGMTISLYVGFVQAVQVKR